MLNIRIGLGHDTHRLTGGNSIRLGGVDIPHSQSLVGFSDADVLVHAVIDALTGAANLPDIGQLFPDSDLKNKDRDSMTMLAETQKLLSDHHWRIINIDMIVFAELPKIAPYKEEMKRNFARVLGLPVENISIKGKTGEKVGMIGRLEAISAEAAVLLKKIQ